MPSVEHREHRREHRASAREWRISGLEHREHRKHQFLEGRALSNLDAENAAGKQRGRAFKPGQSGNPAGKPAGTRHKATRAIEALLEGEAEALSRKAIEKALECDTTALRLCLDRLAPTRKDAPISFSLPSIRTAADTVAASSALLEAVAASEVTPEEAGRVMALLSSHKALVEAGDLEARITALEAKR